MGAPAGHSNATMTADSAPFDRAVSALMRFWKPPPDIKKVIVSELGATLALVSGDTHMTGPPRKKTKNFRDAKSYLKKRYTWKMPVTNRGRPPKQFAEAIPSIRIGGRKYTRGGYKADGSKVNRAERSMILKYLAARLENALERMGSSKAMWLLMYKDAARQAGVRAIIPKKWKNIDHIRKTLTAMRKVRKWKKATKATSAQNSRAGNWVLTISSSAQNSLNKGVGGLAAFQARINGRDTYMNKNLGKKVKISMKQLLKKYPGLKMQTGM
tara:strand:+ start:162 stop:971 length:810 start_codon:yes stop_codon:yes gene_type:complete